jgi:hypothetical protein
MSSSFSYQITLIKYMQIDWHMHFYDKNFVATSLYARSLCPLHPSIEKD